MVGNGVLVLGAGGRTGRLLVDQLLRRDQRVTALVRDAAKARIVLGDRVGLVEGDLRDVEALRRAASECDRVIFVAASYGDTGRGTPRDIDFGAVEALAAILDPGAITRFVLLSSAGVTQPEHPHNCSFDSVLKWKLRGEEALRGSGLPYTIVRALGLRDRPAGVDGVRIVQGDRIAFGEDIARADAAAFLADVACLRGGDQRFAGLNTATLLGATCEIFNDATVPGDEWRAARRCLSPDPVCRT